MRLSFLTFFAVPTPPKPSKICKKCSQNLSNMYEKYVCFISLFDAFWTHVDLQKLSFWHPKCIQNRIKFASEFSLISFHRFLDPKIIQNASKKGVLNLRKFGFGQLEGHWNPQGAPESTNVAKMEPKGPPRLPKCNPGDTQKWKNGVQCIPRTLKMQAIKRPKLQKWNPRDPLSSQNEHRGIQGA